MVLQTKDARDVILDSINEGVFTIDLDWRITSFNRAAEKATGVPRREALNRPCREIFQANICQDNCALKQTFETGQPVVNANAFIVNHQGQRVPIRVSTAILKNEVGEIIGGVETFQDLSQIQQLQKQLHSSYTFEDIIGRSPEMQRLFDILPQISKSSSNVLIEGASGTGKELFARAIHNLSPRKKHRFVPVNCAALPDTLLESELFGHRAGAFTDARRDKAGRFTMAHKGTIFLDEIGEVGEPIQIKLLQVIQERIFNRVGGHRSRPFRGRVIAATNLTEEQLLDGKTMRKDFFYRLCSDLIVVPSLAQRIREDPGELEDLLQVVIQRIVGEPSEELVQWVKTQIRRAPGIDYTWPGNVRELEQCVRRILLKRQYTPLSGQAPPDLTAQLKTGLQDQSLDAKSLVGGYCFLLYQAHQTIEAVARITGLDRRTAKKHIENGRQRFHPEE